MNWNIEITPFQTTNRELYGVEGALSYTYGIMEYDIFRFIIVISGGTRYVQRRGNVYLFIYLFIYLASPQGQGHHNSVSQLLWARIT